MLAFCTPRGSASNSLSWLRGAYSESVQPVDIDFWKLVDGSGPSLALCHGGPGLWDYFDPLAALLRNTFRVCRWDQRGCGRSGTADDYGIDVAIQDLQTIKVLCEVREPWVVLGHSWGAYLALLTALEHPESTRGLVYVSGTGSPTWWKKSGLKAYKAERERRLTPTQEARHHLLAEADRDWHEEVEYRRLSWLTDFADHEDPPSELEIMTKTTLPINWAVNRRLGSEQFYVDDGLLEACQRCPIPSLFIHGSRDPRSASGAIQLADVMPNAQFVMIDGAGHFPWVERPAETYAAIQKFTTTQI